MRLFKQCGSHCNRAGGAGLAIAGSTFSSAFLSLLMDVVFGVIALFYIAIRLGKEDGKWGLFTVLVILFAIGLIGSWLD